MEYRIATLNEIRVAFFGKTRDALAAFPDGDKVWLAAPAQDAKIDLKKLAVICSLVWGETTRGEFGGPGSAAERHGFWKMQVSILAGTDENLGWELAQALEDAFLPYAVEDLPVASLDPADVEPICPIFCDFPYTENLGVLPDKRSGICVTVPFWTRTQAA